MNKFVNRKKIESEKPNNTFYLALDYVIIIQLSSLLPSITISSVNLICNIGWCMVILFLKLNSIILLLHSNGKTLPNPPLSPPSHLSRRIRKVLFGQKWFMNMNFEIESTEYLWLNFFSPLQYFVVGFQHDSQRDEKVIFVFF